MAHLHRAADHGPRPTRRAKQEADRLPIVVRRFTPSRRTVGLCRPPTGPRRWTKPSKRLTSLRREPRPSSISETDINGLRALAVLSVVIFHADRAWLPGGFVGVDIFFVISGFLISRIILAQCAAGRFSLAMFYAQRAKRILPALLVVGELRLDRRVVRWTAPDAISRHRRRPSRQLVLHREFLAHAARRRRRLFRRRRDRPSRFCICGRSASKSNSISSGRFFCLRCSSLSGGSSLSSS